ncbi:MAG: ABC transporter permease, partial [Acutalibacteraceae bacterium]|nr:ABC transporter permease [Acutalibacteraceae bacterium]
SAEAAAKISPMESIRSSKENKVGNLQKKNAYNSPKFIKKILGIGGSIAWKNMKRSRRQYRTTVLSIIISVAIYLTAAAFVNYNIHDMQSQSFFKISAYNMQLSLTNPGENQENQEEQDKKITPAEYAEYDSQVELIRSMDGVKKSRLTTTVYSSYLFPVKEEDISSDIRNYEPFMWIVHNEDTEESEEPKMGFAFCAVDDNTFEEICLMNGKSMEECRDKCFIKNKTKFYGGEYSRMGKVVREFENPVGMKLTGTYTEQDWVEVPGQFTEDGYPVEEPVTRTYTVSTEIAGTYPQDFVLSYDLFSTDTQDFMVVSQQWFREHIDQDLSWSYTNLIVDAENPSQLSEDLQDMKKDEKITILQGVNNYAQMVNSMRSAILVVQIFVYGFILIIALIGVTNIFNTITTNMKLRQKEFAMLRSIGTTKKEFNRMIHLESLLYTMKSLLFAIPIGLIGSGAIQWVMNLNRYEENRVPYFFPWAEILLCLVVVLCLLLVIMRFSIAKVSKQNIIETIRNDNI